MPLASLLGRITTTMQAHSVCRDVKCIEARSFSAEQFYFKVRSSLWPNASLQVRVYFNAGHIDYAYQVFTSVPLVRWDNKEDYPDIGTFPHHCHDEEGHVSASDLSGDPAVDIQHVLDCIENRYRGWNSNPEV